MNNWTELKRLAEDTEGWQSLSDCWPIEESDCDSEEFSWEIGAISEGDKYEVVTVNTWQYDCPGAAEKLARYYAAANPKTILALIAENERLRADGNDVFGLAQARADTIDQLRAEVEALRKDAERYRWIRKNNGDDGLCELCIPQGYSWIPFSDTDGKSLDMAIDTAMDHQ